MARGKRRSGYRRPRPRSSGGFLSGLPRRIFGILKSPAGLIVVAISMVAVFLVGGKVKESAEGLAAKIKGSTNGGATT